jgi:hypothetical protein
MNQSALETALNDLVAAARAAGLPTGTIVATLEIVRDIARDEDDG